MAEGTDVELSHGLGGGYETVAVRETEGEVTRTFSVRIPITDETCGHNIRISSSNGLGGVGDTAIFSSDAAFLLSRAFADAAEKLLDQARRNHKPPVLCDGVSTKEASE